MFIVGLNRVDLLSGSQNSNGNTNDGTNNTSNYREYAVY